MKKTAIFRDKLFVEHDPGYGHLDSPDRMKTLYSALDSLSYNLIIVEPPFQKATRETLLLNHSSAYIDKVAETSGKIYSVLDSETYTSKKSYEAACLAVGALTTGVDLLFQNKINNAFALVRPPGHHAEKDTSKGFCIFNNVAIAAHYAQKSHGTKKLLIVDLDVHHGNGTQNSFYDTDKVLYISIHQSSLYPGTGNLHETGTGKGEGYTINIPFPGGQGDLEYANIFNTLILPIADQYQPELILVSAGFDAHVEDVSEMRLTSKGFAYMARELIKKADEFCGGKILFALEGGYDLNGLKEGVFAVINELADNKLHTPFCAFLDKDRVHDLENEQSLHPAIERVKEVAKNYWKM
ncbi:MAG: histone deacetylase [Desulforhopalus sp.]